MRRANLNPLVVLRLPLSTFLDCDKSFWSPVTESKVAKSADAVLDMEWRKCTRLGLDNEEHIQGMLFGRYNNEAYAAGVAVAPMAALVGLKDLESNVDLLALIEGIVQEERFEDLF